MEINSLTQIWNYPLFVIGTNNILVKNIALALLMLYLGSMYYRAFAKKIGQYLTKHYEYDTTETYVIQRVFSYVIACIYISFILDLANIPLTTFSFLGGTIALSIGLGAQTLISNFLSGFLVMIEKSLKIGDTIQIDGVTGIVESIGIRSTLIRTFCNSEVIIPNSDFMHNVFIKLKGQKGIAEKKARIEIENHPKFNHENTKAAILDSLKKLDCILHNPEPKVYLEEFQNNRCVYLLYFYPSAKMQNNKEYLQDAINHAIISKLDKDAISITHPSELALYNYKEK
ncbi:MAG UNVERIFIED_CONTAM: mechanosensitive ion channel [Rickettsiaceae bacterium]|jgi:small-conductance mechanosensitive channel